MGTVDGLISAFATRQVPYVTISEKRAERENGRSEGNLPGLFLLLVAFASAVQGAGKWELAEFECRSIISGLGKHRLFLTHENRPSTCFTSLAIW